jgi:two-component system, NtrC family, sensor kinase
MGDEAIGRDAPEGPLGVYTVGEHCRKCYSCVRICPTKAIMVHSGEANIIAERCISCGCCVDGCSQGAKRVRSSVAEAAALLGSGRPCAALLAPSFPAAFPGVEPERLAAALAACGFSSVHEVAYGADLVSREYARIYRGLLASADGRFLITTPCPAVVSYVEKLCPDLVPYLARVMSPMEAMARVVRERGARGQAVVFIGPCVAKKAEAARDVLVDAVLTFPELAELCAARGVDPAACDGRPFDPPRADLGRVYPVTGGLLRAAGIDDDLLASTVAVVEGSARITELLQSLQESVRAGRAVETRLFDLLFCEGCIAGPGMTGGLGLQERVKRIVDYTTARPGTRGPRAWARANRANLALGLGKAFRAEPAREEPVPEEEIRRILAMTGKVLPEHELNCRACGYGSCREKAVAVHLGMAEVEMCLPYLITKLETAIADLKENQVRLIHAEKLASMGQMAAGIAHELNNPLGVILMYAYLLKEDLAARGTEAEREDVERLIHESERTRSIVKGILNFARQEKVDREPTDINALLMEAVGAARALDAAGRVRIETDLDPELGRYRVDRRQIRQVFDNVIKNAVEAMPGGGTLTVESRRGVGQFTAAFLDTGPGIPPENLPRLFSPFFTTKPVGKGTGLGLVVCYGIVKMHGGTIRAENLPSGGARFEITVQGPQEAG